MALETYQKLLCRMIASPDLCDAIRRRPEDALHGFDLDQREKRRLAAAAASPGMRVSAAIHRANRLDPLHQTLPLTCFLLGDQLGPVVNRYWAVNPTENLQLPAECERFSSFLEREIAARRVNISGLREVAAFERCCVELRYLSENELRAHTRAHTTLPPLVRIVPFQHDPEILLGALLEFLPPPDDLPAGEFYLLVDCRSGDAEFRSLTPEAATSLLHG